MADEVTLTLRHGHGVEFAADGRPVDRGETGRRGQLIVGRRLLEERRRDQAAGRQTRRLTRTECRCLLIATEADRS